MGEWLPGDPSQGEYWMVCRARRPLHALCSFGYCAAGVHCCPFPPLFPFSQVKRIFVGGLSSDSTEDDIRKYFEQFGKVSCTHTHTHTHTHTRAVALLWNPLELRCPYFRQYDCIGIGPGYAIACCSDDQQIMFLYLHFNNSSF